MITYQQAKQLKDSGFPQKHNRYSKYYLNETQVIDFETAHSVYAANSRKTNDVFEEIHWTIDLVYIPTLEDLLGDEFYEKHLQDSVKKYLDANKEIRENAEKQG